MTVAKYAAAMDNWNAQQWSRCGVSWNIARFSRDEVLQMMNNHLWQKGGYSDRTVVP